MGTLRARRLRGQRVLSTRKGLLSEACSKTQVSMPRASCALFWLALVAQADDRATVSLESDGTVRLEPEDVERAAARAPMPPPRPPRNASVELACPPHWLPRG